ncbi:acyltransferase family protein [Streptomyces sp. RY43-2]|uniref:Acyltransferase family protein n=1 Tax=Streptomyces macrolidinus TaxID=2952607 RepID=A0ABT0Z6Q8_9ACTN|nr:acyltransferase family protein [Streptomyces macrolidinus]MCN9239450.1 acyltransferase family protein [Streptomyces macrolidinus]
MFPAASSSTRAPGPSSAPPEQSAPDAEPSPRDPQSATPPGKRRDAFFDNAKYLAIVLVAMGHAWEPLKGDSRTLQAAYMFVYAFHMPAFIVISGYFSRSFDMRPAKLKRLVTGVLVPYVVFETAYTLFERAVGDDPDMPISLLDPWYLTWFLVALFVWRLTTPLWKLVRHPVPVSIAIALLASMSPDIGDDLDLQRVLQFMPFFVIGLSMKPEHFQAVRRRGARLLSLPVIAAAAAVAWWAVPRMNPAWFYHRDAAQELAAPWWCGPVMVLGLLAASLVLTACFFAWVPGRTMWFTTLGTGTLYGYLLHGFFTKTADFRGWLEADWLHGPLGALCVTLLAASLVTVLCTAPVRRVFRFAMEPTMDWAFKRDAAEIARERVKS